MAFEFSNAGLIIALRLFERELESLSKSPVSEPAYQAELQVVTKQLKAELETRDAVLLRWRKHKETLPKELT